MTDRPIIFSAPMVRALLAGEKTQTRRMAWRNHDSAGVFRKPSPWQRVASGDRLWVRESFQTPALCDIQYRATATERIGHWNSKAGPWKPSIHMPRWASRLTLTVRATRIERLQEISAEDALAEGISWSEDYEGYHTEECRNYHARLPERSFMHLWCSLHGDGAWESNPEVAVIAFACETRNIDAGSIYSTGPARPVHAALRARSEGE